MTDWSYDIAAAPEGEEVILAFTAGTEDVSRVLARRAWFPAVDAAGKEVHGERVQAWSSTFGGERLPAEWRIYAWCPAPVPPDADGF